MPEIGGPGVHAFGRFEGGGEKADDKGGQGQERVENLFEMHGLFRCVGCWLGSLDASLKKLTQYSVLPRRRPCKNATGVPLVEV